MRLRPAATVAALVLAPALVLTACSGGSSEPAAGGSAEAADAVRATLASTREAGTARVALTSESTVGGTPLQIEGEGLVDLGGQQSQLTLTLPFGEVEQRTVDGTAYVSVPQEEGVFFSIDAAQLRGSALGGSSDPVSPLTALSAAADVQEAGQEEVRGESTTRYDGVVDVAEALEQAPQDSRAGLQATLGATGLEEVPFSAWLDEDGRLRRFQQELTLPASEQTGGQEVTSTTTLELYDYGVEVDVQAPPAESVRDGSALLGGLPGGQGTTG